jgi:hypothetical protein
MIYYICSIESDWPIVESLAIALGIAQRKAVSNPELAEALSMIPRYFVTDELGSPVAPRNPARVIF